MRPLASLAGICLSVIIAAPALSADCYAAWDGLKGKVDEELSSTTTIEIDGEERTITVIARRSFALDRTNKIFVGDPQQTGSQLFFNSLIEAAQEVGANIEIAKDPADATIFFGLLTETYPLLPGYEMALQAYQPNAEKRKKMIAEHRSGGLIYTVTQSKTSLLEDIRAGKSEVLSPLSRQFVSVRGHNGQLSNVALIGAAAYTLVGVAYMEHPSACPGYEGVMSFKSDYERLQPDDLSLIRYAFEQTR